VKPEFEDQRTFITEHFFQALGTGDGLIETRVLYLPMYAALQHLAVPVAEKDTHAALGGQLPPVPPGRRAGQFLIGLLIEGTDFDQARVHPLIEQLDGLAFASTFDAINQDDHREALLLLQLVLHFQQRFTQGRHFGVVGVFVDGVTNFCGFEHGQLPSKINQD